MTVVENSNNWDSYLKSQSQAHILQTSQWGQLKNAFGWKPKVIKTGNIGAQILFRQLPLGFTIGYLPMGPVNYHNDDNFWQEIDTICKQNHAIYLKIEPDILETQIDQSELIQKLDSLAVRSQSVQPQRTIIIDLTGTEDDWLKRMKQKTRYNIKLAQRKEVIIQQTQNVSEFHKMMNITGTRDGFGVHSQSYYQKALDVFFQKGDVDVNNTPNCALLSAEYNSTPLAMLMVFAYKDRSWYLYGASTNEERNRMPTYLLQWEAMRWAANQGCKTYDLWGVPDQEEATLEENFTTRSDGLWGVYRFKRGFGGQIVRTAGSWDRIYNPLQYQLLKIGSKLREGLLS